MQYDDSYHALKSTLLVPSLVCTLVGGRLQVVQPRESYMARLACVNHPPNFSLAGAFSDVASRPTEQRRTSLAEDGRRPEPKLEDFLLLSCCFLLFSYLLLLLLLFTSLFFYFSFSHDHEFPGDLVEHARSAKVRKRNT